TGTGTPTGAADSSATRRSGQAAEHLFHADEQRPRSLVFLHRDGFAAAHGIEKGRGFGRAATADFIEALFVCSGSFASAFRNVRDDAQGRPFELLSKRARHLPSKEWVRHLEEFARNHIDLEFFMVEQNLFRARWRPRSRDRVRARARARFLVFHLAIVDLQSDISAQPSCWATVAPMRGWFGPFRLERQVG